MSRFLTALSCLLLCGCMNNRVVADYAGSNAGSVITSAGLSTSCQGFAFEYRNLHPGTGLDKRYIDGMIIYAPRSIRFWARDPDFTGEEKGIVTIHHLEPGDYEIYTYKIFSPQGAMETYWLPTHEFSLKFTVTPGKALYLGNFHCVGLTGKNFLGLNADAGGYFVISDRHERDVPIAMKQEPGLPTPTIAVPDVAEAQIPTLLNREPN